MVKAVENTHKVSNLMNNWHFNLSGKKQTFVTQ